MPDGRKHRPQLGRVPHGIAGHFQRSHKRNICIVEPVRGLVRARQLAAFVQALRKLRTAHGIRVRAAGKVQPFYCRFRSGGVAADNCPAQAAYAKSPVPELPASAFSAVGGSLYTGASTVGSHYPASQLMFLPRIGFAYALNAKTTLRGGYGVYYDTLNAQNQSPDQSGFSLTTTNSSSNDFGQTWLSGDPRGRHFAADESIPAAQRRNALRSTGRIRARVIGQRWKRVDFPRSELPACQGAAVAAGVAAAVRREDGAVRGATRGCTPAMCA